MKSYVDVRNGLVSREIFVNEDVYRSEQERIFCKSWLFIGHASQAPNSGDYFVSRMGEEEVIMVRDRDNEINVLLNSCRHRGMKVCRYDEGSTRALTCPYHGWSFDLKGNLIGVPRMREAYFDELDKSKFGLLKARSYNDKGMIWATWDFEGPSFEESVGAMKPYLDGFSMAADGSDDEIELLPGIQKWIVPCNWKFPAENSIGDLYHDASHASVEMVGVGPGGKGQTRHGKPSTIVNLTSFPKTGHGFRGGWQSIPQPYPFPAFENVAVETYFRGLADRLKANMGDETPAWRWGGGGNIFPNMNFHTRFPHTIMVAHPAGPTHTEMWRWFFVEKNAPDEVKEFLRHYLLRYSGPGGMVEQDDMENWNAATAASKGVMAKKLPYNMQMGLGHWTDSDSPHEGARYTEKLMSEGNALTLYGRWQEMMDQRPDETARAPVQAAVA